MSIFIEIVLQNLRLTLRSSGDIVTASMFFVIAVVLFSLGVGPEPAPLRRIAAGVIWSAALLAPCSHSRETSPRTTRTARVQL